MPSWMLRCPGCSKDFEHSRVEIKDTIDFFLPQKPDFPADGSDLKCPNCERTSTYHGSDLVYQTKSPEP